MNAVAELKAPEADLDALFNSLFETKGGPPAPAPALAPVPAPEVVSKTSNAANDGVDGNSQELIGRIGKMTRALHEGLCALGFDKMIESTAAAIPDARDRLSYVANMTEQAAQRALNAIDTAKPIQDKLGADAGELSQRWETMFTAQPGVDEFKALVAQTREFLRDVPEQTRATDRQLTEIMMAQDFQDLTGQVIKKVTEVVHHIESQLLALLVDNAPPAKREEVGGLLNGPVINSDGRTDVVTSQKQADELLESLGF